MMTSLMAGLLIGLATAQDPAPETREASQVDKKFLAEERKRLAGEKQCWKLEGEKQQVCFDGLFAEDVYKDTNTAKKWRAQREKFRGVKFENLNKAQIDAVGQFKCHNLEDKKQAACYDELYVSPAFANKPTPKSRRWVIARKLTDKLCGPGMGYGEFGCTSKEQVAEQKQYRGAQAELYRIGCNFENFQSDLAPSSNPYDQKGIESRLRDACQKQLVQKERPYEAYADFTSGLSSCPNTLKKVEGAVSEDSDKAGFAVHWMVLREEAKYKSDCREEVSLAPKRARLRELIESSKCSTLPVILDPSAVESMSAASVASYLGGCDAERGAVDIARKPKEWEEVLESRPAPLESRSSEQ